MRTFVAGAREHRIDEAAGGELRLADEPAQRFGAAQAARTMDRECHRVPRVRSGSLVIILRDGIGKARGGRFGSRFDMHAHPDRAWPARWSGRSRRTCTRSASFASSPAPRNRIQIVKRRRAGENRSHPLQRRECDRARPIERFGRDGAIGHHFGDIRAGFAQRARQSESSARSLRGRSTLCARERSRNSRASDSPYDSSAT